MNSHSLQEMTILQSVAEHAALNGGYRFELGGGIEEDVGHANAGFDFAGGLWDVGEVGLETVEKGANRVDEVGSEAEELV